MTKFFKRIRALVKESRGFTLIEMMTVMGILSVLSAITFPAVAGTTSFSRATTQTVDLTSVQQAVDRFTIDTGSDVPTLASLAGTTGGWQAGELPEAAPIGGDGSTSDAALVFTQEGIAGFDFSATFESGSTVNPFIGSYLRDRPKHDDEVITLDAGEESPTIRVNKRGENVYVKLKNTTAAPLSFLLWGLDSSGGVWVFVDRDFY